MGQDNTGKPSTQEPGQDQPGQDQPGQDQSGQQSAQDQPIADAAQEDAQASIPVTADDHANADDLLHAAHAVPPADMVANVELTLDQLSATVDLFDIPPFDYGDTGGGDA
jgi:hypothetical protein